MTNSNNASIIILGNEHTEMYVTTYKCNKHYIACPKQNVVFLFYSLLVQIMYIIVNKATFIVTEIINPSIRNSKKSTINTTSLSHSKNYEVQWQHTSAFYSFPMLTTILHFLSNYKRTFEIFTNFCSFYKFILLNKYKAT